MKTLASETFPLSGNRLIEASAGTGKTYTITNLYLRLLLGQRDGGEPLAVSQILVLTFTIAATEELRSRIRHRINEARRAFLQDEDQGDPFLRHLLNNSTDRTRDTKLLAAALQLMDEASIFTIHGFCARVLADHAFETGTLFDQDLDADKDALLELAAEDCFRSYILTLPQSEKELALSIWDSPAKLQEKIKPFLFRSRLTLLPPEAPVSPEDLEGKIQRAKAMWLRDDFEAIIKDAGFYANSTCVTRLPIMTEWCRGDELNTDLWQHWTSAALEKTRQRKGHELPGHPLIDLIDEIVDATARQGWNLWHRVVRIIRDNLARYKADLAQLTLDDLLTRVNEALAQDGGRWLAPHLARRWPVAMIDEFQDTDDIQYEIFRQVYSGPGEQSLLFIGDPKQAIYQFRGADVYTYINARRAIDPNEDIFSLATNWRSSTPLINAVNTLFDQSGIFDNDDDIPFERVEPSPVSGNRDFIDSSGSDKPITLALYSNSGEKLTLDKARQLAMAHAAEETSRLLTGAARGEVQVDGKPLQAGQIAFLVRNRRDARAARDALAARQIHSVYVTLESVFLSDTAEDLKLILQAVLEPTSERALRAALAVPLMQATAHEIDTLSRDVIAQQQLLEEFQHYHELWSTLDIATMLDKLIERRQLAAKWFGHPDGERQITNLRHLTELLQQRSAVAPGMHRLLKWYTREKLDAESVAGDERQLRLESDRDLVQIVTMHASKGLEYDVVMIPMAVFTAPSSSQSGPYLFHDTRDERFHTFLDFSDDETHKEMHIREQLAEDMRLLYVAITRAKHKCYIGLANTGSLRNAALKKLLKLEDLTPGAVEASVRERLPDDLFDIEAIESVNTTPWPGAGEPAGLRPPPRKPVTRSDWRLHSYTGMSRQITAVEPEPDSTDIHLQPGFADDEVQSGAAGARLDRFNFPRGPKAGIALHTLLEDLDFTLPPSEQQQFIARCVDRAGIVLQRDAWIQVVTDWMADVLATPFADGAGLETISRRNRLDEMEFHLPIDTDARLLGLLKAQGYMAPNATLSVDKLAGMLTGLIDLVFESGGKFWLVDYKSNHLGDTTSAYTLDPMREAMTHHQYDLQYLLYCVALNRYLRARVPGFSWDAQFGGVRYLFLRGMTGKDDITGIYGDKPDEALIDRLDTALGGER